jgi:hypothetical protein
MQGILPDIQMIVSVSPLAAVSGNLASLKSLTVIPAEAGIHSALIGEDQNGSQLSLG